jgi:hypothetical protein
MIRKSLWVVLLAIGGGATWFAVSSFAQDKPQLTAVRAAPNFVHTVIFHLKTDAPAGAAEGLIADAHELLRPIPSVRDLKVGRPAEKGTPDLAKKDYQVALVVLFDNQAGLETYLKHPLHLKYVEKHGQHIDRDKLVVYDFVNQRK